MSGATGTRHAIRDFGHESRESVRVDKSSFFQKVSKKAAQLAELPTNKDEEADS